MSKAKLASRKEHSDGASATNVYAPPAATPDKPTDTESSELRTTTTQGQRIAGVLLLVKAIVSIIAELASGRPILPTFLPDTPSKMGVVIGSFIVPIIAIIVDIVLGTLLLAKKRRAVPLAVIRIVLGMIISGLTQIYVFSKYGINPWFVIQELVVSGSVLMILAPRAKTPRILVGTTLFGLHTMVTLVGIGVRVTGTNPLASVVETASGNIVAEPAKVVTGKAAPYKLTMPSDKWHSSTRDPDIAGNSPPDRWIIRPDVDAHIMVYVDEVKGTLLLADEYTDASLEDIKSNNKATLVRRTPLRTHPEIGRMLHMRNYSNGLNTELLIGVVATYERGFQIQAFAPHAKFAAIESELRSIVESFELPPDKPMHAPEDCEKDAVTRVEGVAQKYVLTAPGEHWYLRKSEAAKKDNAQVDRWIVRPDKDAHIWVIVEAQDEVIDLEKYTDALVEAFEADTTWKFISREAMKSRPSEGRILRARSPVDGVWFEYLYGVFVEGKTVFQVAGTARSGSFSQVEADFRRTIEQFELPRHARQ